MAAEARRLGVEIRCDAPVARVAGGSVIRFETGDVAYERLAKGETVEQIGLETFNRVTGPVFVEGAAPGDALRVEILDVEIVRSWSVWLPGFGALGAHTQTVQAHQIPLEGGRAVISKRLSVPIEPMIGCIGLAPAEGVGSTFMPAYHWGGNMDLREMSPGTVVDLPVQVPGGLLSIGDHHAAMGRGEPTWVIHGREENMTIHDEGGMRHFYSEWSRRMGRKAYDPFNERKISSAA